MSPKKNLSRKLTGKIDLCQLCQPGRITRALLKNLFGEQQMSALADYVQAALMLNYTISVALDSRLH